MIGIMYLIVLPILLLIYILIILSIARKLNGLPKKSFIFIFLVSPVIYPFAYHISPLHMKFNNLCETSSDVKYINSIPTDIFPSTNVLDGLDDIKNLNYKGYIVINRVNRNANSIYLKNSNYTSDTCGSKVCPQMYSDDLDQCLAEKCVDIIQGRDRYKNIIYVQNYDAIPDQRGIFNDILRSIKTTVVSGNGIPLATYTRYTYYKYGTGWASLLGASSGSAPSINCKKYAEVDYHKIFPPNKRDGVH